VRHILKNEALARAASAIVPKRLTGFPKSMAPVPPTPPAVTEDDRAYIHDQVADDLQKLESMVACDLSCWPSTEAPTGHHAETILP